MNKSTGKIDFDKILEYFNVENLVGQNRLILLFSSIAALIMSMLSYKTLINPSDIEKVLVFVNNFVPTVLTYSFGIICQCIGISKLEGKLKTYIMLFVVFIVIYIYLFITSYSSVCCGILTLVIITPLFIVYGFKALKEADNEGQKSYSIN